MALLDPNQATTDSLVSSSSDERARLHSLLKGLAPLLPHELDAWCRWAPRVGRYSMYWGNL